MSGARETKKMCKQEAKLMDWSGTNRIERKKRRGNLILGMNKQ